MDNRVVDLVIFFKCSVQGSIVPLIGNIKDYQDAIHVQLQWKKNIELFIEI